MFNRRKRRSQRSIKKQSLNRKSWNVPHQSTMAMSLQGEGGVEDEAVVDREERQRKRKGRNDIP